MRGILRDRSPHITQVAGLSHSHPLPTLDASGYIRASSPPLATLPRHDSTCPSKCTCGRDYSIMMIQLEHGLEIHTISRKFMIIIRKASWATDECCGTAWASSVHAARMLRGTFTFNLDAGRYRRSMIDKSAMLISDGL